MVSLVEGWKKYFQRTTAPAEAAPEQILLDQLTTQLQTPEETLIPDPDWAEEPESSNHWQRPVLFMIACALLATALGYTLTKDWWIVRQQQNLERNIAHTTTSLKQQADQTTTQIQDGLEQLLPPAESPPLGKFLPPAPAVPSVQFAPPALRLLPPAPTVLPPIRPLPPPPSSQETVRVSVEATRPKIALIGGNQNVVLLSVGGERFQMVPGQTGPDGLAVVSIRSTPTHYRVGLRLGDGHPLELSIAYASGGMVRDPVAPIRAEDSTETITPIF